MTDPTSVLTPPSNADPLPPLVDVILGAADILSPTAWVRWVLDQVFDHDPVQEVVRNFSGDWNAVMQSSNALDALGAYHGAFATRVVQLANSVAADWDGVASEEASEYFRGLASALDEQERALANIAGQYQSVAVGMSQTADLLAGLFNSLMDWVIIAAASAAAAAASSWTVVGGIIGGSATAAAIAKAIHLARQIANAHALAVNIVNGVVGTTAGYLGAIHGFSAVEVPGAYNHRGVQR